MHPREAVIASVKSRPLALLSVLIADQNNKYDDGKDHGVDDDDGRDKKEATGSSGAATTYAPTSLGHLILCIRVGVILATMSTCGSVMWSKVCDRGRCEVRLVVRYVCCRQVCMQV